VENAQRESHCGFEVKRATGGPACSGTPPVAAGRNVAAIIHSISQDADIDFRVNLLTIYRETENYLARLGRAANEGRAVDEANNFLRWLYFSGVLSLLEQYAVIDEKFLTLRKTADNLQDICKPHLQGRNVKESPSQSRIDEINDKVDAILSAMARNVTPPFNQPVKILDVGGVQV